MLAEATTPRLMRPAPLVTATRPVVLLPEVLRALMAEGREVAGVEGLESAMQRAWDRAQRAHPGVLLSWRRFAPVLARRLETHDPAGSLSRLCVADLYLARAVLAGDATAGERFDTVVEDAVEEINAERAAEGKPLVPMRRVLRLERRFLVGEGRRPALARYRGRGRLRSWVQLELRKQLGEDDRPPLDAPPAPTRRPAPRPQRAMRVLTAADEQTATLQAPRLPRPKRRLGPADEPELLRRAFVAAIAKMEPSERDLLQRFYVEGQTLEGDKASTPRPVAQAKRRLLQQTRRELSLRAPIGQRDLDRLIGHLRAGLGVQLGRRTLQRANAHV